MPSTYSPNKKYELQATGENDGTWGVKANADYSIIDLNLGGRLNIDVSGSSNVTLTATQTRNIYHHLTGTLTGSIDYIFPATQGGDFIIYNNTSGAYDVTVKPDGGTGIVVVQGSTARIFINPDVGAAVNASPPTYTSPTTTRGDMIVRGASADQRLAIGSANNLLKSDGTDPGWGTLTALLDAVFSSTQGVVLYRGASAWSALSVGTSGQALQTQGAAANPAWATVLLPAVEAQGPLTGGANITTKDLGNLSGSTITPNPGNRGIQKITNNGAGTIAPGSNYGAYLLEVLNTTGAGTITTSGWTKVAGGSFDTTTTSKFLCHCTVTSDFSAMIILKIA